MHFEVDQVPDIGIRFWKSTNELVVRKMDRSEELKVTKELGECPGDVLALYRCNKRRIKRKYKRNKSGRCS